MTSYSGDAFPTNTVQLKSPLSPLSLIYRWRHPASISLLSRINIHGSAGCVCAMAVSLAFDPPRAGLVGASPRQQQSDVWSAERTAACIDLHTLSLPSTCLSTDTQMLPTATWIHASTLGVCREWPQDGNNCERSLSLTVLWRRGWNEAASQKW